DQIDVGEVNLTVLFGPERTGQVRVTGFDISPMVYNNVQHSGVLVKSLQEVKELGEEVVLVQGLKVEVASLKVQMAKLEKFMPNQISAQDETTLPESNRLASITTSAVESQELSEIRQPQLHKFLMRTTANGSSDTGVGSPDVRRQFQPEMVRLDINYATKIPTKAITDALCGLESHNFQEVLSVLDIILRQHASRKSCLLLEQSGLYGNFKNFTDPGGGVLEYRAFHNVFITAQDGLSLNLVSYITSLKSAIHSLKSMLFLPILLLAQL
ncbi:hypothetical protein GIB67_026729, partial [Kingdonia uniflora]